MKPISFLTTLAASALLAGALNGCTTNNHAQHKEHYPGSQTAAADMKTKCDMHKQMMGTKTPAERKAMMEEHMKDKSPDMRKHMQMMQEHCK